MARNTVDSLNTWGVRLCRGGDEGEDEDPSVRHQYSRE